MLDSTEKDDFREILAAVEGVGTEYSESRRQNHAAERRTVFKRFVADSGNVFADDDLGQLFATASEVESIILGLIRSSYDPLYDANKEVLTKIISGFVFRREDKTKKDLFIRLIDFDKVDANIFKVVNQVEIQGKSELRIPDAVVYINGLPIVVIEFKSATGEKATIHNAYEQLTIRYTRDIPDLMRWMRFFINLILPHSLKEHRLNSWNVLIMRSNMCKSRMIWKSVLWLALRG